jgi:hypothetical protein
MKLIVHNTVINLLRQKKKTTDLISPDVGVWNVLRSEFNSGTK